MGTFPIDSKVSHRPKVDIHPPSRGPSAKPPKRSQERKARRAGSCLLFLSASVEVGYESRDQVKLDSIEPATVERLSARARAGAARRDG